MRFHRESRPHAADDLAPHGQAQRSGPRRIGETWDLDLLPVGDDPRAADATAADPADLLSRRSRDQLADELLDADVDLVPNSAHRIRIQILAGRIVQLPIFISFARTDGACVTAAHRYDHVGRTDAIVRERFWKLSADVQANLAHGLDHTRIQGARRLAAGRSDVYATCRVTIKQRRRHLAPPRRAHAHAENLWDLRLHRLQITALNKRLTTTPLLTRG